MKKRILCLTLALIMLLPLLGCGARVTQELDHSKTTLVVGVTKGGVGIEWLQSAIEKFEAKYADYSFEEGKKGVQVVIGSHNRTTMIGSTLIDIVQTNDIKDDIFFVENVFYNSWIQKGNFLDITQYIYEDLTDYGEDKSIADKMDQDVRDSLTVDGKMYALPFYHSNYLFVYNATLFDEESWYLDANGEFTNARGNLGTGPDGKTGTYDDGLPRTYDEFFKVMDQIAKDNCQPIAFPGASQEYVSWLTAEMAADAMGYDQFKLNYTLDGTATLVKEDTINWDTMTFETEEVQITAENGYELARQPGLLYSLKFAERLLQSTTYYNINNCLSGSYKISQSQLDFVRNPTVSSKKNIAILIDGSWWENEASASFQETFGMGATKYDADMEYKAMPFPKPTEEMVGQESLVVGNLNDSYCLIKSNIAENKKEAAVKFMQFCHTDAQLNEFTSITSLIKPFNYDTTSEKTTSFGQSIADMQANSKVALPMADTELFKYASNDFWIVYWMQCKYDPNKSAGLSLVSILNMKEGNNPIYDAESYWQGIMEYRENERWVKYKDVLN